MTSTWRKATVISTSGKAMPTTDLTAQATYRKKRNATGEDVRRNNGWTYAGSNRSSDSERSVVPVENALNLQLDRYELEGFVAQILRIVFHRIEVEHLSGLHGDVFLPPIWVGESGLGIIETNSDERRMPMHHRFFMRSILDP